MPLLSEKIAPRAVIHGWVSTFYCMKALKIACGTLITVYGKYIKIAGILVSVIMRVILYIICRPIKIWEKCLELLRKLCSPLRFRNFFRTSISISTIYRVPSHLSGLTPYNMVIRLLIFINWSFAANKKIHFQHRKTL